MYRLFLTAALALGLSAMSALPPFEGAAFAQDAAAAQTYLQARQSAFQRIMSRPVRGEAAIAARRTQLTAALAELLDYTELARRALGEHDAAATPAQRAEFTSLLRQLVERSYQKSLESTIDYEIRYVGSSNEASAVTIRTIAKSRTNGRAPEVSIDYAVHQVNGAWRVYDVATDGVSLVRTYRSQFHRIVARDGVDALLVKMRERLANEGEI